MNEAELLAKMDEVLLVAKNLQSKVATLEANVESLQRTVEDLRERVTYRERVLVGWKEITAYLGYSETRAKVLAEEEFDPLPVLRENGRAVAYASALDAYKMRTRFSRKVARLIPRENDEHPS
jgi:hypothetical protein